MKYEISLLNLPSSFLIDDKVFPPLGLLYLQASLKAVGIDVYYYDFAKQEIDIAKINIKTKLIGISFTSPQTTLAIAVSKTLREKGHYVIAGGCGVSSLSLTNRYKFDLVLKGECENLLPKVIKYIGSSPFNLMTSGLRKNIESQIDTPDINEIPYPDRSVLKDYSYILDGRQTTTMMISRGCPYGCTFCVSGNIKKVRIRTVENILGEIDEIHALGYRGIMFFDDIFISSKRKLLAIGNYLKSKDIVYRCFSHIKYVKEETIKILIDTGCKEICFGIESGSDEILQTVKKGFTSKQAKQAVKLVRRMGLRVKTFFMVGLPGETKDTIDATYKWLNDVKPDDMDISIYMPFPNTDIYDNRKQYDIFFNGHIPKHYKGKADSYEGISATAALSAKELVCARDEIENKFKVWK